MFDNPPMDVGVFPSFILPISIIFDYMEDFIYLKSLHIAV